MTVEELAAATGLAIDAPKSQRTRLRAGDRLTVRGTANRFAEAAPLFRSADVPHVAELETRVIELTPAQRESRECPHARDVRAEVTSSATGCDECRLTGDDWVHLRICMTCGGVRCCDSSRNQHATKHFHASGHPIIRSYEPGEAWAWCYPDEATL
jgi:hypothetical protein